MKVNEYIVNCVDRILMADCARLEFRRRSEAIAQAVQIAADEGLFAAHNHLRIVVADAETGKFTSDAGAKRRENET